MKVYVTKYALTRGILLMEVSEIENIIPTVRRNGFNYQPFFYEGEYFKSESEAIKDAEQRKEKKLIHLHNQISKLENKNVTTIKEV